MNFRKLVNTLPLLMNMLCPLSSLRLYGANSHCLEGFLLHSSPPSLTPTHTPHPLHHLPRNIWTLVGPT